MTIPQQFVLLVLDLIDNEISMLEGEIQEDESTPESEDRLKALYELQDSLTL